MLHMKWYLHEGSRKRSTPSVEDWKPRLSSQDAIKETARELTTLVEENWKAGPENTRKRPATEECDDVRLSSENSLVAPEAEAPEGEREGSASQRNSSDEWATSSQADTGPDDACSEEADEGGTVVDGAAAMLIAFATQPPPARKPREGGTSSQHKGGSLDMDANADGRTDDGGAAAKLDQPKRSVWRPQWKPSWKPPNGHQLLPQDSSPALEGGSPAAAATVVALMPAVRANSFEWLPARPPAPTPAPAPAPKLTPKLTPTLAPASAAVGKDMLLNHFVWNDAGRSVALPQPAQRHYVESLRATVVGMSATLLPASDNSIHSQSMQFCNAPAAINKGTKAKKKEPESKFKWKPLKIAKTSR
jgi:hypothetical protein